MQKHVHIQCFFRKLLWHKRMLKTSTFNAIVTNQLRATYGVYFTTKSWNQLRVKLLPVRRDVYLQEYILHLHRFSLMKTQNINTKHNYIFRSSCWWWVTCNEQVLLKVLLSWASVVITFITVRVSFSLSCFNNTVSLEEWWRILILVYTSMHPCKICPAPYSARLISNKASLAPYDVVRCPARHQPILTYSVGL